MDFVISRSQIHNESTTVRVLYHKDPQCTRGAPQPHLHVNALYTATIWPPLSLRHVSTMALSTLCGTQPGKRPKHVSKSRWVTGQGVPGPLSLCMVEKRKPRKEATAAALSIPSCSEILQVLSFPPPYSLIPQSPFYWAFKPRLLQSCLTL